MTLHNRLDPGLFDEMAQPDQHGDAKDRGKANPSRLRDHKVSLNGLEVQKKAPRTAMWHGMLCLRASVAA